MRDEVAGADISRREVQKKNFKLTLFKDPYFKNKDKHEYHEGWGKESKYTLKANMTDLSQAKNVTCARVFGAITKMRKAYPEGLQHVANHGSVDGFPFLIYLNEEYHGLYMWMVDKSNMTDIDDENPLQAIVSGWTNTQVEIPDVMPTDVQTGLSALKEFWNNTTGDDFKNGLDADGNVAAQGIKNNNRWNGLVLSVPEHSKIKKGRLFCSGTNLNGAEVVRRNDREWCGFSGFRVCDDGVIRTKVNLEGPSIITTDKNTFVSRVAVPVVAGHKYKLATIGSAKSGQVLSYFGAMFYDESGNYIGFDMDSKSGSITYEVKAPENAVKATYFIIANQAYNWSNTQDADTTSPEGWLSWVEA